MSQTTTQLPDGSQFSLRPVAYTPLSEHTRHRHDHCSITLILSGALEEGANSAMQEFGAFSIVTKPAGVYHQDRYGPRGTRTFQLSFTTELAREFCSGLSYAWERGGPAARAMLALFCRESMPEVDGSAERENGIIEVLTCVAESSLDSSDRLTGTRLNAVTEFIDSEAGNPISIRQIAGQLRMHPVSLARVFRRQFGCSITDYIRRRRVANACELMDIEGAPLAHIAVQTGFADQPHFTRAFKTETGVTPGVYRHLTLAPEPGSNRSRLHKSTAVF
jgi:AraC family transcriptional regulator